MSLHDDRSPDFCGPSLSFPTLIGSRREFVNSFRKELAADGWWFQQLDDKLAGYVYAATSGFNPPEVYYCGTDLNSFDPASFEGDGFVVRATNLHSNKGIYVLPNGFGAMELIRGVQMSLGDIQADLFEHNATTIVVEEFVAGEEDDLLPTEIKFHAFDGEIGSINILSGRGTDCGCWAEIDEAGERLDKYG